MTDLHLSLDEIIKKRNIKTPGPGVKNMEKRLPVLKRLSAGSKPVVKQDVKDARFKLLHNRRLGGQDARLRLLNRKRSHTVPGVGRLDNPLLSPVDPYIGLQMSRPPLLRTIDNVAPFFPRRHFDWDRPAEDDDMNIVTNRISSDLRVQPRFQPSSPDLRNISITVHSKKPQQTPGILKKPPTPLMVPQPTHAGKVKLSERFNRDRSAEAAQKVEALKVQLKATAEKPPPRPEAGHRLIVSNLAKAVTQDDVKELFADIGELVSSKLIHPGVAEVVYREYDDAARAVEVYHCRQLDGQPMICHMVANPDKKTPRPSVELNMSALRNALHKKPTL